MGDYRYTELSYKITSLISRTCCLGSSGLTNTYADAGVMPFISDSYISFIQRFLKEPGQLHMMCEELGFLVFFYFTLFEKNNFSWTSPDFFQTSPQKIHFYKISSYQGFTSKQILILVSPLSFKNSNP